MRFTLFALLCLALVCCDAARAPAQTRPQAFEPIVSQTSEDLSREYAPPSASAYAALRNGQMTYWEPGTLIRLGETPIGNDFRFLTTPYVVQRLTKRTYWLAIGLYSVTVVEGRDGLMLIDSGGGPLVSYDNLVAGLAAISDKPVTTLVYSHPHTDHVGHAWRLAEDYPRLRVIATDAAAREIGRSTYIDASGRRRTHLMPPNEILSTPVDRFTFDDRSYKVVTPVAWAHSGADSYVLTPDRVLHAVDLYSPGRRVPFVNLSGSAAIRNWIDFGRHLLGEQRNWDYGNFGHFNIASPRDVRATLGYVGAMYEAWAATPKDPAQFVTPDGHGEVWLKNWFDGLTKNMVELVALTQCCNDPHALWGDQLGFEIAREHAAAVHFDSFLNTDPGIPFVPDLSALPPPE